MEEHKTVFLHYKDEPVYTYDDVKDKRIGKGYPGLKPSWAVKATSKEFNCEEWIDVTFCPHCGQTLPEIEKNPAAKGKRLSNNDDNYCNTCKERNSCCRCTPAWFAWRPVGVETLLPPKGKRYDD